MQLYFIRHGQSENNLLWYRTGSNKGRSDDPNLTATGQQQAKILAEFLRENTLLTTPKGRDGQNVAGFGITYLYSSLMVRAVATGLSVARALDLPLVGWEDLHEGGGLYLEDEQSGERIGQRGKNRAFFEAHFPDLVLPKSLDDEGWWNRPYETPEQRSQRAQRVLRDLQDKHGGTEDRVAVISHGGFYNDLLAALLDRTRRDGFWFVLNNTAITRIDFSQWGVDVVYLNRADFLPKELVT